MPGSNGAVEESPKRWAFKFISGKYQGGMFLLLPDQKIAVGRSSEMDMVLVEDMVSRKHAKISTLNNKVAIRDLNSTNGTFVNGEKISSAHLHEGDRVLIGTSILKLVPLQPGQEVENLADNREVKSMMEQTAAKQNRSSSPMSGMIDEVPLPDLLQLFSTSRKSGILVVRSQEQQGRLFMREGKIYYASIENQLDIDPHKAFLRMVTWSQGFFTLMAPSSETFSRELDQSTEELLMEAMRQQDELERIRSELPSPTVDLTLAKPMTAALSDLSQDQLDILQLVHNLGKAQAVLDKSLFSDLETFQYLLYLIQNEYIEESS